MPDDLVIGGKNFNSRLIVGTGRYRTNEEMVEAIEASGTEMVTVAIRRLNLDDPTQKTILDYIDWSRYNILPNTAGCATVEEAMFVARLGARGRQNRFCETGSHPRPQVPVPRPGGYPGGGAATWWRKASPSCPTSTPTRCWPRRLEEVGCATVMPLGSAIGSGQGIHTVVEVRIIIEQANVPVVVDAGLGRPVRRVQGPGNGRFRGVGEHRHCPGAEPGANGGSLQAWRGSRAQCLPGRSYSHAGLRFGQQPHRRSAPAGGGGQLGT